MVESFKDTLEKALFDRYLPCIACPKCKSEDVLVKTEEGYFWVYVCKKCNYKKNSLL